MFLLKQWKLRATCSGPRMNGEALGCARVSARGLRPKAPFPARHNEPDEPPPFVLHFKTDKHLLIKSRLEGLCFTEKTELKGGEQGGVKEKRERGEKGREMTTPCKCKFHH